MIRALCMMVFVGVIALAGFGAADDKLPSESYIASSYTEAQQHAFFDAHMRVAVKEWFIDGQHPLAEVRELFEGRRAKIQARYGKPLDVRLISNYDARSKAVKQGSAVENGVPILTIIVPAAMDDYASYEALGTQDLKALFENSLIVGIAHELDHLAFGFPMRLTNAELDHEEISAWALTCDGIIRIFVEKGMPVSSDVQNYYRAWVEAGRTQLSLSWATFIKQTYAHVRSE